MAYDKTKFLSGLAMGLCGKGNPTFTASDVFGKGYLLGAELRAKRVTRKPIAVYLQINPLKHRVPVFPNNLPHPYTIVVYNAPILGYGEYYRLINSDIPVTVDASGKVVVGATAVQYTYSSGDAWTLTDGDISASGTKIVWADHDVYDVNGALVMAESEATLLYGEELLFDGTVNLVQQEGTTPTCYAYKFEGLPLTPKDYKVVSADMLLAFWRAEGTGDLTDICTVEGKDYEFSFYFDDAGAFWISTEHDAFENPDVIIRKYLF